MSQIPTLRRAGRFLRDLFRVFDSSGCLDSAASLTYTTLFAVVPMVTVMWAIMKSMPQLGDMGVRLEEMLFTNLVPATGAQVRDYLSAFSEQASNLTGIGIAFLLVTALLMLLTVERRINSIWRVHRERGLVSSLLVYWALLSLGPVLLGVGIAASSWLLSADLLGGIVGPSGSLEMLLQFLPFLMTAVFFSLLYIVVPNCAVPIREGVIGGVVAALLFELAKAGFGYFVTRFNSYELVYGAFAAVPLFLLWIYISWSIVLFGVVLVYTLANWDDDAVTRATAFPALLRLLQIFHDRQDTGGVVSDREARHAAHRAGIDNWHDLREMLLARRYLERLASGDLVLLRDLHTLKLSELARLFSWEQLDARVRAGTEPDAFAQAQAERLQAALAQFNAGLDVTVAEVLDAPESTPANPAASTTP